MTYITIPQNIKIQIYKNFIKINSPVGEIIKKKSNDINLLIKDDKIFLLKLSTEGKLFLSLLYKTMINLSKGCYKILIIEGVGYKMAVENKKLIFKIGFSHDVIYNLPKNIDVFFKNPNFIVVYGTDFEEVSQIAAEIRKLKMPEPYKGKGIRYINENIIKKKGKAD